MKKGKRRLDDGEIETPVMSEEDLSDDDELYKFRVEQVSKYLSVLGMFEQREGNSYSTYNDINDDIYTWKSYSNGNDTLRKNNHGLLEIPLNLTHATIMGTENHLQSMPTVTSRYQIRFDRDLMKQDALAFCKEEPECSQYISDSQASILGEIFDILFENYAD